MRLLHLLTAALFASSVFAQHTAPKRPPITGIAFVRFATSDPAAEKRFFEDQLGYRGFQSDAGAGVTGYRVDAAGRQLIETVPGDGLRTAAGQNRLLAVGLRTTSVGAMREYLAAKGLVPRNAGGVVPPHELLVHDPEGNTIVFTDRIAVVPVARVDEKAISRRIIHAGFVVQSEIAENRFYRDVLGFKPYWHGGMHDGVTDFVSQQVPDGTDWIEYMLNVKPDASAGSRGVSNHVSLGVEKMGAAVAQLKKNGCDTRECNGSQMGRDGKVQLNLYDPDHSRVEVMEFAPTGPVCCSPYTGRMPSARDPQ